MTRCLVVGALSVLRAIKSGVAGLLLSAALCLLALLLLFSWLRPVRIGTSGALITRVVGARVGSDRLCSRDGTIERVTNFKGQQICPDLERRTTSQYLLLSAGELHLVTMCPLNPFLLGDIPFVNGVPRYSFRKLLWGECTRAYYPNYWQSAKTEGRYWVTQLEVSLQSIRLTRIIGVLGACAILRAVLVVNGGMRRRRRGCCAKCGYCLRGLFSNVCPECGSPIWVAH